MNFILQLQKKLVIRQLTTENGEVRWYLIGDYKWDIQRLNNGHILLSSDKTLRGNYSIGLIEMDLLGKVYYE